MNEPDLFRRIARQNETFMPYTLSFCLNRPVYPRHIDHAASSGLDRVFDLLFPNMLPLVITACRYKAAPLLHSVRKHWFCFRIFTPRIEYHGAIFKPVSPYHRKCSSLFAAAICDHRNRIGWVYFTGQLDHGTVILPVHLVNNLLELLGSVFICYIIPSTHSVHPISIPERSRTGSHCTPVPLVV